MRSRASSVRLPHCSLTLPFISFHLPLIWSEFMETLLLFGFDPPAGYRARGRITRGIEVRKSYAAPATCDRAPLARFTPGWAWRRRRRVVLTGNARVAWERATHSRADETHAWTRATPAS